MLLLSQSTTPLPILALLFSLLLVLLLLLHKLYQSLSRRRFRLRNGCLDPKSRAPVRDPFIGLDFVYDAILSPKKEEEPYLDSSVEAFRRLGTTYTEKRWTWEVLYTCDGRNIKHMLSGPAFGDFELPRLRKRAVGSLLGRGIFTLDGSEWKAARAALRTALARLDRGDKMMDALERHFQATILDDDGGRGHRLVDLQSLFFRLTMDFAGDFLMGISENLSSEETFLQDYTTCSTEVVKRLRLGPLQHLRRLCPSTTLAAKRRVYRRVEEFIAEALSRTEHRARGGGRTLLAELAAVTVDGRLLRDQLLHMLVASRDTTASVLSNLFFVLARHPHVYATLRKEVLAVVGDEGVPPTVVQLKQMHYLRWCVNESLRLHPPIPTNAREATRDTTLPYGGGPDGESPILVRKGVVVMYNVYALHRDERIFGSRSDAFEPERWMNLRPGWAFLPFSGGPRVCMGQQLALTEIQYVVARMAQTFDAIEGQGERNWVGVDALATTCRDGVKVSLTRAHSNPSVVV
ncbi:hypothetical protein L249_2593 [Ophiocordyceps polyrhachis-furcata BCC 54312]|uniref:Cytochrome P450 n=1 Tax=Ophiocordyceps polyrhachis-furcata BCC 54312 TaxID=1330021 RepID=A0A367LRN5_9HYPO|nr:hypothetical protein L249_2593 [Ophiocordyceps polyrhachis-furcata BCC 54312]